MSHRLDSVALGQHPVCCSCADLPLSGMPCPPMHRAHPVRAGRAAVSTVPATVVRVGGADVEVCCFCGAVTDQGYYSVASPAACRAEGFPVLPRPGVLRRAWRALVRVLA